MWKYVLKLFVYAWIPTKLLGSVTLATNGYNYFDLSPYGIDAVNKTSLLFSVKTCNDAHVGLFPGGTPDMATDVMYEIVIGGWSNTKSKIRNRKQGFGKVSASGSYLNCAEFVQFWISWNDGIIQVGLGHEIGGNVFLIWEDPVPYAVNYIAISSFDGVTGEWIFGNEAEVTTVSDVNVIYSTSTVHSAPTVHSDVIVFNSAPTVHVHSTPTAHNAPTVHSTPTVHSASTLHSAPTVHSDVNVINSAPTVHSDVNVINSTPTIHSDVNDINSVPTVHSDVNVINSTPTVHSGVNVINSTPTVHSGVNVINSTPTIHSGVNDINSTPTIHSGVNVINSTPTVHSDVIVTTGTPTVHSDFIVTNNCSCESRPSNITEEEFAEMIADMKINITNTSKYRRKLVSSPDSRLSSKSIGGVGIGILLFVLSLFIILDLSSFFRFLRNLYH